MKFKKFDSEKSALDYSENECNKNKCLGVTKYWYNVKQGIDGWYVVIHDGAEVEGAVIVEPQWFSNEV